MNNNQKEKEGMVNKIVLELSLSEVNIIIKALSERPFREVYDLVGSIHAQSNSQLSPKV